MADFTPNQNTALFMNAPHMSLLDNIRAIIFLEGLVNFNNFDCFIKYQLNQAFKNMRTAIPEIPAVSAAYGVAVVPAVASVPPVLVSSNGALRLKVASIANH